MDVATSRWFLTNGRNDLFRNDLASPSSPNPALSVVPAGKDHDQIKVRDNDQDLSAVPCCCVCSMRPVTDAKLPEVPCVSVFAFAIIVREFFRTEPGRCGRNL